VHWSDGTLYKFFLAILKYAGDSFPVIYSMIAYFFLFTQAAMFNRLVNDKRMMPRPNYLAGMCYLLITSLFSEWNYLSAPLIINSFLIWIWAKLPNLAMANHPKSTLFNIGIITGISTFIYLPSFAFALLIIVGLIISLPFKPAEWIVTLIGIFTPYYFVISWLYLTGKLGYLKIYQLTFVPLPIIKNYLAMLATALILFAFFTGCFFVQRNFRKQLVLTRKSWSLLLVYLGIALLLPFVDHTNMFQILVLSTIPVSAFAACAFFYPEKSWFPIALHWAMFVVVIATTYFTR